MPRRPPRFHSFIGHKKQVDPLLRQLAGAQTRNEPLPHTLLIGPSGVGKTLLAQSLADEFRTNLAVVMGYVSPADLAEKCVSMNKADFLFVDECHAMKPTAQEMLFRVIDDRRVLLPKPKSSDGEEDEDATTKEQEVSPFTLILATDQPGRMLNALRKRLPNKIRLGYYPIRELKGIVDHLATELDLLISPQAAMLLAKASAGLPRRAKHHLQKLRLHFPDSEQQQISLTQARGFLHAFGIDKHGLGSDERRYLSFLNSQSSAALESIALHLGLDDGFVRREIEAMLIRNGLVTIGQRGRQLTLKGKKLVHRKKRSAPK